MSNLQDVIAKKMERMGISRQVEAVGVVERATAEIAKLIPRDDFRVISYKDGVLRVYFISATVASEVFAQKSSLLKKIGVSKIKYLSDNTSQGSESS